MSTRSRKNKKKELEVITLTSERPCYFCKGKGCNRCDSGIYKTRRYILIYKGQAFDVDTLK